MPRFLARRVPWLDFRGVRGFRPSACTVESVLGLLPSE
ncbi:hypothetical protein RA11412_0991 [Rothia aeria]|uniref:Uncharacterized protein n=1 Tax=Rothia aeria TaxID=172042 RepID=A0A2Z5QYA2_9MICC|nr:hypothetical protein RA11412_0991 [Rothia aeria]